MKTYRITDGDGLPLAVGQVLERDDGEHFLVLGEPLPGLFECVPNDTTSGEPPFYLDVLGE